MRLRSLFYSAILFTLTILISSCAESAKELKTRSTGRPGEILILSERSLKSTPLGDTLRSILEQEYPYIPQSEPSYDLRFLTEAAFDNVLRPFRNVLWVKFMPDSTDCGMRIEEDRWSSPQSIIYLYGPDESVLTKWVATHRYEVEQAWNQVELSRLKRQNRRNTKVDLQRLIREHFGIILDVPQNYTMRLNRPDFIWLSYETPDISQGLFIYKWKAESLIDNDALMSIRNLMTKAYVPGPTEGSYMIVSEVVPPEAHKMLIGSDTVERVRGFWEVHGHPMGGSYVSFTRISSNSSDSLVTTEGYIYAPRFPKRNYMRQLEAILLSQFDVHRSK